jgi:hypothetical protein
MGRTKSDKNLSNALSFPPLLLHPKKCFCSQELERQKKSLNVGHAQEHALRIKEPIPPKKTIVPMKAIRA